MFKWSVILGNALAAFIDIVITGTICYQLYRRGAGLVKYVRLPCSKVLLSWMIAQIEEDDSPAHIVHNHDGFDTSVRRHGPSCFGLR